MTYVRRTCTINIHNTHSCSKTILAGVLQGSELSPTLYKLHCSVFPVAGDQHTKPRVFADVTTLRTSHKRPTMAKRILRGKLEASCPWTNAWRVKINPIKSNSILMMSPP
jgi:hypothetical protein